MIYRYKLNSSEAKSYIKNDTKTINNGIHLNLHKSNPVYIKWGKFVLYKKFIGNNYREQYHNKTYIWILFITEKVDTPARLIKKVGAKYMHNPYKRYELMCPKKKKLEECTGKIKEFIA